MNIEQKLREKIEQHIWDVTEIDHDVDRKSMTKGAELLLPLLVEAYEALSLITIGKPESGLEAYILVRTKQVTEKIEKFVGENEK